MNTFLCSIVLIAIFNSNVARSASISGCTQDSDCSYLGGQICIRKIMGWGDSILNYCGCPYGIWDANIGLCKATISNAETSLCLSTHGYWDSTIQTDSCNGADYEKWAIINIFPNIYKIKNINNKKCLSNRSGSSISVEGCNNIWDQAQQWKIDSGMIYNQQTGNYLDSNGKGSTAGQVYAIGRNGGNNQKWNIND